MSDAVQLALIASGTTVVTGFLTILTLVITHMLNQKKLERIEHLANGTLTALQQRAERMEEAVVAQLPAETNPKKKVVVIKVEDPKEDK